MIGPYYIALGANLGDPKATFRRAVAMLVRDWPVVLEAHSALYRTAAVGGPSGQAAYLNAVLRVRSALAPRALLDALLTLEQRCGRVRRAPCEPRTLDLDLLLCAGRIIDQPGLNVPHPRLHQRLFVLAPLHDLAPDCVHPVLGQTVRQLRDAVERQGGPDVVRIEEPGWMDG